jgi:hypothetical protein
MEILTYNYFNKIIVPDFIINDDKNLRTISTFNQIYEIMDDAKIHYLLSGSLARSILTKTCFRTWGDIDILINLSFKDFLKNFCSSSKFIKSDWKLQNPVLRRSCHTKVNRFSLINLKNSIFIEIYIISRNLDKEYKEKIIIKDSELEYFKYLNTEYAEININNNLISIGFDYFRGLSKSNPKEWNKNRPYIDLLNKLKHIDVDFKNQ